MENKDALSDACNMEISMRPEPHLEVSQDLELLAQEIAEAAVEEERRSSTSSSPTPSQFHMPDFSSDEMLDADKLTDTEKPDSAKTEEVVGAQELEEEDETVPDNVSKKKRERGRSQSPVDEASWEIVDSVDELSVSRDEGPVTNPAQNHCIVRKFLGSHDLWQKLKDLGMVCDICNDQSMNSTDNQSEDVSGFLGLPNSTNDLTVSCTESMVICDMPQDEEQPAGEEEEEGQCPLPLRTIPDSPRSPSWKGRVAGATVVVELERVGGLLIASVRVNHTDLLSALASLQQLAASAGLVSYADVDIQSILARAA